MSRWIKRHKKPSKKLTRNFSTLPLDIRSGPALIRLHFSSNRKTGYINIVSSGALHASYEARASGNVYVVIEERGEGAQYMPPFLGRRFNTPDGAKALLREMLTFYVMANN